MTKLEEIVDVIVKNIKSDMDSIYKGIPIADWNALLDTFGLSASEMKEEIYHILAIYSNQTGKDYYMNDDYEIILENGDIITYRQLSNLIRKKLF